MLEVLLLVYVEAADTVIKRHYVLNGARISNYTYFCDRLVLRIHEGIEVVLEVLVEAGSRSK